MPLYKAYGLEIDSFLDLPELIPSANNHIDLKIKCDRLVTERVDNAQFHYWRDRDEICLFWRELGTFLVKAGREIIVDPLSGVAESDLHPALLGGCMAVALHQRGYLILHASAINLNGQAIAFIGDKGWGKSTMARAFIARRHQFITDDVLAIDLQGDLPMVFPSFPQLKLCPDAIVAMGEDPATLPRVMSQTEKRQYQLSQNFNTEPVPLHSIYLLGKAELLRIEEIAASNSILPLLAHSYGARFGKKLLHLGEAAHFLQCSKLANKIDLYSLQRPSNISLLTQTVDLVERHLN